MDSSIFSRVELRRSLLKNLIELHEISVLISHHFFKAKNYSLAFEPVFDLTRSRVGKVTIDGPLKFKNYLIFFCLQ